MRTISFSELSTFSTCRKKWSWIYQHNLEKRQRDDAPLLGSACHAALEGLAKGKGYSLNLLAWLYEEEKRVADSDMWEEDKEAVLAQVGDSFSRASEIVSRYQHHVHAKDTFELVAAEQKFEVPIPGTDLALSGYFDSIVKDETGKLWLMDHKVVRSFTPEEILALDMQLGIYHWCAKQAGYDVVGLIYNQIRNCVPKVPSQNKNGTVSKVNIMCDWETYAVACVDYGQDPNDYLDMREKLAGKEFYRRYYLYRSERMVENFARNLFRMAQEFDEETQPIERLESSIFLNTGRSTCGFCPFRELCLDELRGGEGREAIIQTDFGPRTRRYETAEEIIEEESLEVG